MQRQLLTINFDLKNKTQASFVYKQGEIDHNGVLVELVNIDTKNSTGQVRIKDPEGKLLEPGIVIVNEDTANFVLPTYLVGTWEFEVRIFNDNGTTISNTYSYDVLESLGFDVTSIEQYESVWDTWTKEFVSWESSENTRVTNENTRVTNENSRKTAETSRVSADNTRESRMKDLETRFNNMTASQQGSTEVVDARTDYNGAEHDSLKTRLDNDYETLASLIPTNIAFDGYESVTTNDTLSGDVKGAVATGQTMVNVAPVLSYPHTAPQASTQTNSNVSMHDATKTYTVMCDFEVTEDNVNGQVLRFIYADNFTEVMLDQTNMTKQRTLKIVKVPPQNKGAFNRYQIGYIRSNVGNTTTSRVIIHNLVILEGDHTDKPLEFFEGLKSAEVSEVTSHGVNLVDCTKLNHRPSYGNANPLNVATTQNTASFNPSRTDDWCGLAFDGLDPSKTYRINILATTTHSGGQLRLERNRNMNAFFAVSSGVRRTETLTGLTSIGVNGVGGSSIFVEIKEFSVVEVTGSEPSTYVPYSSSKTTLSEPIKLRSLPNGVADTYDVDTGVLTRRCGEVVLNGSESWTVWGGWTPQETQIAFNIGLNQSAVTTGVQIVDRFKAFSDRSALIASGTEGVAVNNGGCGFVIAKSKLPTPDIAGFKAWLTQNPTTVVYQLATPTTEYIENNGQLRSYDSQTTVFANSVVPVKISGNIPVNYASTLAKTLMRVDELKEENKKLLETIDTLSNDVNQIHAFMYAMMGTANTLEEPEELIDNTKEPLDDTKELIDDNEEFLGDNSDDTKEFLDDNSDLNDDEVI